MLLYSHTTVIDTWEFEYIGIMRVDCAHKIINFALHLQVVFKYKNAVNLESLKKPTSLEPLSMS